MQQQILKFAKRARTLFTTTNKSCSFQQAIKFGQTYYTVCGVEQPIQYNDIHSLDKFVKKTVKKWRSAAARTSRTFQLLPTFYLYFDYVYLLNLSI